MATPEFQVQTFSISPKSLTSPLLTTILTKALADGSPIDVSSGYTFYAKVVPSANANPLMPIGTNVDTHMTFTGTTTGITVETGYQLANNVPYLNGKMNILASNDGGTTSQIVGTGSFALPSF